MSIYNAYLIKGYLIDKKAPKRIMEALDMLIGQLHGDEPKARRSDRDACNQEDDDESTSEEAVDAPDPPEDILSIETATPAAALIVDADAAVEQQKPVRKSSAWTPERKAAQAEIMRKAREAKAARKPADEAPSGESPAPNLPEPPPPHRLTVAHPGYVGKRDPGQPLTDEDWSDIKARLVKSPDRRAIASDYDVDIDDLNYFITSCQRREARSLGEAGASPSGMASGAARQTWYYLGL